MTSERRRFLIIYNARAGQRTAGILERTVRYLAAAGAVIDIEPTDSPEAATRLASAAALSGDVDAIVGAGGDGTVAPILRGLLGTDMPFGLIPTGSANVLARELGLVRSWRRRSPRRFAAALLSGPVVDHYPLEVVDGRGAGLMTMMAGAGFDAMVLAHVSDSLKARIGRAAFVPAACKALFGPRPSRIDVSVDGKRRSADWVVLTKGRHFAGPFRLSKTAQLGKPSAEALLLDVRSPVDLMRHLLLLGLGQWVRYDRLQRIDFSEITLESEGDIPIEIDGDLAGELPVTLRLSSHSIRVISS